MVAGKSVSNEANTSRTLATASKTPASSRSSIPTSYLKISPTGGIVAPEKKLITSEVSSGKHDISPTSGVTTSIKRTVAVHEEQPVTRTPVAITEKKPITLATVKSVSSIPASEIPSASPTGESPGYIFRGIPIKM